MARILVVDDEKDLVWAVSRSLVAAGYEVMTACDGTQALAMARRHPPDMIILDILMPRDDGLHVCRRLRSDFKLAGVPILFLSMKRTIEDRLRGLEEGADDYLAKPFDLRELHARVKALLRRSLKPQASNPCCPSASPLILDSLAREVQVDGKKVLLTPMELDLLCHFMSYPGEVFSYRELLQLVWGYPANAVDGGLVRWHIKNLRAKIETDPACPAIIRTVPRHGYVFVPAGAGAAPRRLPAKA